MAGEEISGKTAVSWIVSFGALCIAATSLVLSYHSNQQHEKENSISNLEHQTENSENKFLSVREHAEFKLRMEQELAILRAVQEHDRVPRTEFDLHIKQHDKDQAEISRRMNAVESHLSQLLELKSEIEDIKKKK
jgi:hypothetical protein